MGIPLVRGRLLDERRTADAANAVIVNETLARRHGREGIGSAGLAAAGIVVGLVGAALSPA